MKTINASTIAILTLLLLSVSDDMRDQLASSHEEITSSWWAQAQENIRASEYEIRWSESRQAYSSPNRAQNLRFTYLPHGFGVEPRSHSDGEASTWDITLSIKGFDKGANVVAFTGTPPRSRWTQGIQRR